MALITDVLSMPLQHARRIAKPMLVRAAVVLFATFASIAASDAQFGTTPQRPDIKAELVVGGYDVQEPNLVWLGLRIKLGSGWKTYWRSPGDGGLPAEFDWAASKNLSQPEVLWPAPRRMEILGVETIGYTGEVVYPIKARVENPTAPAAVSLKLALYACSTLCVRDDRTFEAAVVPGHRDPGGQAVIDRWRERVPGPSSPTLAVTALRLVESEPPRLEVEASAAEPFVSPDLFVESDPPVFPGKPHVANRGTSTRLNIELPGEKLEALRGRTFTVTLVDGTRAAEVRSPALEGTAVASAPPPTIAAKPGDQAIWAIVWIALLGGFILNLMPCVFPVLSLKLLGFVKHEGAASGRVRAGFAASAAGILACFLLLATAMAVLKGAGATVGWGIQFQQPVFLAVMAAILTLFAANLLGLFEIILPSRLAGRLDRAGRGDSLASHFASGFVVTLLATPCSAPFVGTAVAFALSQGPREIYLVFAALGVGMALPYLAVVAIPRLATMLPRPGRWMLVVKEVMAVALLATAAWLVTIVAATGGVLAALALAAVLTLVLLGLYLRGYLRGRAPASLRVAFVLGAIAIPATVVAAVGFGDIGASAPQTDRVAWRRFDEGEVRSLVGSGRTVLVDITAQWCVTCKVNKALVLEHGEVERRLQADVVPIQGDWTKPDERIAAYLQSFGRYGLPFNIVYGPGAPNGIVLPELLTDRAVLDAFARASAARSVTVLSR